MRKILGLAILLTFVISPISFVTSFENRTEASEKTSLIETKLPVFYNDNYTKNGNYISKTSTIDDRTASEILENNIKQKNSKYPKLRSVSSTLYLDGQNYITAGLDQGAFSICWTFATAISAASHYNKEKDYTRIEDKIRLSERHVLLSGYNSKGIYSPDFHEAETGGGNTIISFSSFQKGFGPILSDKLPFYSSYTYSDEFYNNFNTIKQSDFDLKEFKELKPLWPDSTKSIYDRSAIEKIKEEVYEKGAVVIGYKASTYTTSTGSVQDNTNEPGNGVGTTWYNTRKNDESKNEPNHAVAIVGWSDNIEASSFKDFTDSEKSPSSSGAFLVLNSWGYNFGSGGYFWLSYEDGTINGISSIALQDKTADTITQNYAEGVPTNTIPTKLTTSTNISTTFTEAASIYSLSSSTSGKQKVITDVFAFISEPDKTTSYSIYANLDSKKRKLHKNTVFEYNSKLGGSSTQKSTMYPTDGIEIKLGTLNKTETGYYKIHLNKPLVLQPNIKYSLVQKYSSSAKKGPVLESTLWHNDFANNKADYYAMSANKTFVKEALTYKKPAATTKGWLDLYTLSVKSGKGQSNLGDLYQKIVLQELPTTTIQNNLTVYNLTGVTPKRPSTPTLTVKNGKKLSVKLAANKFATKNVIYYKVTSSKTWKTKEISSTKTSYTLTKLSANKKYNVKIRSYFKLGNKKVQSSYSSSKTSAKIKK